MNDCRVAVIELPAGKRTIGETIEAVEKLLKKMAPFAGNTLVVLPENFVCCSRDNRDYEMLAGCWQEALASLSRLAREYGIYLVAGTLPEPDEGRYYITTAVFASDGSLVAKYRKINLFKALVDNSLYDEGSFYSPGSESTVFRIGNVTVGLAICFDLRFPKVFAGLRDMGADIIIVPAAFTRKTGKKHWHVLLRARAVENQLYVAGAGLNGCSPDGYECFGHSMIVDPDGNVVAETSENNDFQVIEHIINLDMKADIRKSMPLTA